MCLDWPGSHELDLDETTLTKIQSFRCGADVLSTFEDDWTSFSASGGATNSQISLSSDISITLQTYADTISAAATVYSEKGCSGKSSQITLHVGFSDNLGQYEADTQLSTGRNIKSIHLPAGSASKILLLPTDGMIDDIEIIEAAQAGSEVTCFEISEINAGDIMKVKLERI